MIRKSIFVGGFLLLAVIIILAQTQYLYAGINEGYAALRDGDNKTAFREFRISAEEGDALAQFLLGNMYYNAEGVTKDYFEAAKWYEKAAEHGDVVAQFLLGSMYYEGKGVTRDYQEAFKWYKRAAEEGDALAQFLLGTMYYDGKGVTSNYSEAFKWFNKAADQRAEVAYIISSEGVLRE